MGQVRRGSATTTHAIRAAIRRSQASLQALTDGYGINPKTVAKWRRRTSLEDRRHERAADHFNHPSTNGQVERMNHTINEATVRRFYYETHSSLGTHLATFLDAYNFAKRLKSLRGLTPCEHICQLWTEEPKRFRLNPLHHMAGLNI